MVAKLVLTIEDYDLGAKIRSCRMPSFATNQAGNRASWSYPSWKVAHYFQDSWKISQNMNVVLEYCTAMHSMHDFCKAMHSVPENYKNRLEARWEESWTWLQMPANRAKRVSVQSWLNENTRENRAKGEIVPQRRDHTFLWRKKVNKLWFSVS